ncbi:MAG TPA: hypothetical protein VM938_13815 [Acidimicrobiales bacterium]|nr:hypothetical protein [Acidimicrobiales bacterium]
MPPVEPPPTRWGFPSYDLDSDDEIVAVGADLGPGTLLAAYRTGLFPMPVQSRLAWWSPRLRGVLPLDELRVSRSLRRSCRRFEVRIDTAFDEVVRACADPARPYGWIDDDIAAAYQRLHRLGVGTLGGDVGGRRLGGRVVRRGRRRAVRG